MRRTLFFLAAIANTAQANAPVETKNIRIRGVDLALPFELRIFVQDIEASSLSNKKSVEIFGDGLFEEGFQQSRTIADGVLFCSAETPYLSIIRQSIGASVERWICKGKNFQRVVSKPLKLSAAAGFININNKMYRGDIELSVKDSKLRVINKVPLDPYLAGLVNLEIRSDYPREAIKAQVIAARSYALATAADRRRAGSEFDLYGSENDQMYQGSNPEDGASFRYVKQTAGQVLFFMEDVLKSYYHSSSGGYSELPQNVWSGEPAIRYDQLAYLARPSDYDAKVKDAEWSIVVSPKMGYLWPDIGEFRDIKVLQRSKGQRVLSIRVAGKNGYKTLSGAQFRKRLGSKWLKSTLFTVQKTPLGWLLTGKGWGHGVGLSQLGAKAMGRAGKKFKDILSFYYPFSNVRVVPELKDVEENIQAPLPMQLKSMAR